MNDEVGVASANTSKCVKRAVPVDVGRKKYVELQEARGLFLSWRQENVSPWKEETTRIREACKNIALLYDSWGTYYVLSRLLEEAARPGRKYWRDKRKVYPGVEGFREARKQL